MEPETVPTTGWMRTPRSRSSFPALAALTTLTTLTTLATLPQTLVAQSRTRLVTSPPGFEFRLGNGESIEFGGHPQARYQFLDGTHGGLALSMTALSTRRELNSPHAGPARSWSRVAMFLAPCSFERHSQKLDKNATRTPTLVFLDKVSWPKASTAEGVRRPAWGGAKKNYHFPFLAPYAKHKQEDLLLDFRFGGGTLANGRGWRGLENYPFDAVTEYDHADGLILRRGGFGCNDSNQREAATSPLRLITYRSTIADRLRAGKVELTLRTMHAAPNRILIQALGSGLGKGVNVGACMPLYLQQAFFFLNGRANAAGHVSVTLGRVPYLNSMKGFRLASQSAYRDSWTKNLRLTQATLSEIKPPPGAYQHDRVSYTALDSNATTGVYRDHLHQPLFLYTGK